MYHRDTRPYPTYDDQAMAYSSGHVPSNSSLYPTTEYQHDGSSHYYVAPAHSIGGAGDAANPPSPYFRSMTPSLIPANRYPNASRGSDSSRYHGSHAYGPSTSASPAMYASQNHSYMDQYPASSDARSVAMGQRGQSMSFIPTPSEIAHSYSSYHGARSPTIPEDPYSSSLDYASSPPHMVPSSHASHGHRPSRIMTGRPRALSGANSTSPPSATSPSGERFLCEKCGKTFSRAHDRKRHHETQHTPVPVMHTCQHCQKEFSRADSLKRHLDNGCELHS